MREYFNIKRWQLVVVWVLVLIAVAGQEDSFKPNEIIVGVTPTFLLAYTLGWLGYRNSNK